MNNIHPFKVSDKVVCLDASAGPIYMPGKGLEIGQTYVISEVDFFGKIPTVKVTGMCPNKREGRMVYETFYKASRFRKLTDIQNENKLKEYGMLPNELVSLGITEPAQCAFLVQTLGAMQKGTKK